MAKQGKPGRPGKQKLADKITENWEAYANREQVIGEHLRNLFNAQQSFSDIVALTRLGGSTATRRSENWSIFISKIYIVITQARIKLPKLSDKYKDFKDKAEKLLTSVRERLLILGLDEDKDVKLAEFDDVINTIGLIYDTLGYSSAERKTIHSPLLSDLSIGKHQKPEEMFEASDDDISDDELPV